MISDTGAVTRPSIGSSDAPVTMTSTITRNGFTKTASFDLTVKAMLPEVITVDFPLVIDGTLQIDGNTAWAEHTIISNETARAIIALQSEVFLSCVVTDGSNNSIAWFETDSNAVEFTMVENTPYTISLSGNASGAVDVSALGYEIVLYEAQTEYLWDTSLQADLIIEGYAGYQADMQAEYSVFNTGGHMRLVWLSIGGGSPVLVDVYDENHNLLISMISGFTEPQSFVMAADERYRIEVNAVWGGGHFMLTLSDTEPDSSRSSPSGSRMSEGSSVYSIAVGQTGVYEIEDIFSGWDADLSLLIYDANGHLVYSRWSDAYWDNLSAALASQFADDASAIALSEIINARSSGKAMAGNDENPNAFEMAAGETYTVCVKNP